MRGARTIVALAMAALLWGCADRAATEWADERRAEGGGVEVVARLERGALTTAERTRLRIETRAAEGAEARWPEIADELGSLRVAERETAAERVDSAGRTVRAVTLTLEPFLPGEEPIPALEFGAARGDGVVETLRIEPFPVVVTSVLDEESSLVDAPGVVDAPARARLWLIVGLSAAVAAVVGALAAVILRAGRKEAQLERVVPPHERALAALDALRDQRLADRGEWKAHFTGLSQILREYIEGRFGLRAPRLTTEEFLRDARRSALLAGGESQEIERFLRLSDLVKFANHTPTGPSADEAYATVRRFVERTAPRGEEAQEGGRAA